MRTRLVSATIAITVLMILTACGGGSADEASGPEATALEYAASSGFDGATITDTAEGDPATLGADAVYCIATDATDDATGLPYLIVVQQNGDELQASQMAEGFYEWDLYGCPR